MRCTWFNVLLCCWHSPKPELKRTNITERVRVGRTLTSVIKTLKTTWTITGNFRGHKCEIKFVVYKFRLTIYLSLTYFLSFSFFVFLILFDFTSQILFSCFPSQSETSNRFLLLLYLCLVVVHKKVLLNHFLCRY